MNKVNLTGNIVRDLELKYLPNSETATTSFTLAVRRRFAKEGQQDTDFINCVAWGKTAEIMSQHLVKGAKIGISGRIQVRSYENKEGKKVYVTEVVTEEFDFLDSKKDRESSSGASFDDMTPIEDSDIPF